MFTHVMIGSNDLEQARSFYDATFCCIGRQVRRDGCERPTDLRP